MGTNECAPESMSGQWIKTATRSETQRGVRMPCLAPWRCRELSPSQHRLLGHHQSQERRSTAASATFWLISRSQVPWHWMTLKRWIATQGFPAGVRLETGTLGVARGSSPGVGS